MFDWNGDGKKDWHDDYVYNEIINTKKPEKKSNNQYGSSGSNCGCIVFVIAIVVAWELLKLIVG